ncbi:hypothetical protein TOT_030000758 [Theileria orientalis strain Shintoku]|uniref:Uncharacterized protein n=1 Tax=Theileria orientalis strain Shintoku TaxID=869250 RepID=J4C435_THEOR|nr:hypothetical protein TOT_030000758 [Theileria orientalis strain Shintoku]PVC53804.1 hypothetical protein MACL_00003458 [Theileria orientalis]BAM41496.1 hypothetical protein TOT_030000758 [Theileria orientalis strain Shintoku]|eukprot:XP_009691797.1 hypothetical protein TOT_030000758 [Theileria orientalis strain Shintoku]
MLIKFFDETHNEVMGDVERLHLKTPKTSSILRLPPLIVLYNNYVSCNCYNYINVWLSKLYLTRTYGGG